MIRITERLFIGNKHDLTSLITHPAHLIFLAPWQELIEKTELEGKITSLTQLQDQQLGIRLLFPIKNEEIPHYHIEEFKQIIHLIDDYQKEDVVVISPDGQSRAPSLVMIWLAKYAHKISSSSFSAARMDFNRIYQHYIPWPGMVIFLNQEWDYLA